MTRWTVRLALAAYFAAAGLLLWPGRDAMNRTCTARRIWTIGLLLYLAHVTCAFHFYHDWRHDRAYEDTARQSRELIGVDAGWGLWFNYAFTAVWVADAAAWWRLGDQRYRARPRWMHAAVHGVFVFMIVNAAVVFAAGPVRWLTLAACITLAALAALAWRRRRSKRDDEGGGRNDQGGGRNDERGRTFQRS